MNYLKFSDINQDELKELFRMADILKAEKYPKLLEGMTVAAFFSSSSIRTRMTYEKGIYLLGGQMILFPSETLDKKEASEDVAGYLNQWADAVIIRHNSLGLMKQYGTYLTVPVINAMSSVNHPCEILSDLYTLSKIRHEDYLKAKYLFVGPRGNIGLAWKEASEVLGFYYRQSSPAAYRMENVEWEGNLEQAMSGIDIVLTDSLNKEQKEAFQQYQLTKERMRLANEGALLNPCPPFYRGEEVSDEVMRSTYFVGYEFKKNLLPVQQAILLFCMGYTAEDLR